MHNFCSFREMSVAEPIKWAKLGRWIAKEFRMVPYMFMAIGIGYVFEQKAKENMTLYRGKSKMFGSTTPPGKPAW